VEVVMFQHQDKAGKPRHSFSPMTDWIVISVTHCRKWRSIVLLPVAMSMALLLHGQETHPASSRSSMPALTPGAADAADILGLHDAIDRLFLLQSSRSCSEVPQLDEFQARQEIAQRIETVAMDLDGALGEIASEQSKLSNLRSGLQARRDRTQGYLNAASLITGSGIGIAVNATQLKDSSAIAGDILGIASGAGSTLFSVVAIKKQNGPSKSVGNIPNMLGPLFDRDPVLHTYYPPEVISYLQSSATTDLTVNDSRLAQLKASWIDAGEISGSGDPKSLHKLDKMTTSGHQDVKLTISDLTDRIGMLGDVAGRISLMKRDMAALMRAIGTSSSTCLPVP
jgi:hypothetical protein